MLSASPVRLRLAEPAACVHIQLFSESATATNQATELARLIVREAPGLPSLTILENNPSIIAGGDFKRAGDESYSHCAPSTFAKAGFRPMCAATSLLSYSTATQYLRRRRYPLAQGRHSPRSAWGPQGSHEPTLTIGGRGYFRCPDV